MLKHFSRRLDPVHFLHQLNLDSVYKDYFNSTLSNDNLRPDPNLVHGHEPFVGSYWYPFPFMLREEQYQYIYKLPHLAKLNEVYTMSIPLFEEVEKISGLHIIKLEINIMPPHSQISTHTDTWGILSNACRIHIPIQTHSDVVFHVNNNEYHIPEGMMFEFNNQFPHSVKNNSNTHRIHYVFDLIHNKDLTEFEETVRTNPLLKVNHIDKWTEKVRREWSIN